MELTFLGTAAAEGYPGLFCDCVHCLRARALKGRDLRRRSALLVDSDMLVDFGPDILAASLGLGLRLSGVSALLLTHSHRDHLCLDNFTYRQPAFRGTDLPTLHVYASSGVIAEVSRHLATLQDCEVEVHAVRAGERFTAGRYWAQAFPATHAPETDPLFYAIGEDEKSFLYVSDTGPLMPEAWEILHGLTADLVIMELTMGGEERSSTHLGLSAYQDIRRKMREDGVVKADARFIAHHLAHHYSPSYGEWSAELESLGICLAYDGMKLRL